MPAVDLGKLAAATKISGVDVVLVTNQPHIIGIADLVSCGTSVQCAEPALLRELRQ